MKNLPSRVRMVGVMDESGRLLALGRMDKARPITVDLAMNKAFTAASFQQLEPLAAKGKSERVRAWRLVGVDARHPGLVVRPPAGRI